MKEKLAGVSIMIPTYNRADKLEKALLSLDKINYPKKKYEVIVVNDGSTDNTEEIVKKIHKTLGYKLKYFYQQNKKLAAARNLAIKNSKSEIIVSVDDDMLFPRNWLRKLIKPLEDKDVGAAGGPSIAPRFVTLFQRAVDHCMTTSFLGTGGMIGTTKKSFAKYYPRGGNMAIRKSVLDKVGLFDEKFIPGEEIELDRRIELAGYKLSLARDAVVWHMPRTKLKGFIRQIYSRGFMKIQFWRRYKEAFELLYFMPLLGVLYLILMPIASLFSRNIFYLYLLSVFLYILLLLGDSLIAYKRIKNIKVIFLVPFLMFLQHLTYGIGTLAGLLKKPANL